MAFDSATGVAGSAAIKPAVEAVFGGLLVQGVDDFPAQNDG